MASYQNFQNDRSKYANSMDIFKRGRNFKKQKPKNVRLEEGIAVWAGFYRANPHRFVEEYLFPDGQVKLKPFQKILLYSMMNNIYFTYIASRGQLALSSGNIRVRNWGISVNAEMPTLR